MHRVKNSIFVPALATRITFLDEYRAMGQVVLLARIDKLHPRGLRTGHMCWTGRRLLGQLSGGVGLNFNESELLELDRAIQKAL